MPDLSERRKLDCFGTASCRLFFPAAKNKGGTIVITCPSDPVVREYLDGELNPERALSIKEHLDHCEPCRSRLEAFRDNDRFVREILAQIEEVQPDSEGTEQAWTRLHTSINAENKRRSLNLTNKYRRWAIAAVVTLCLAGAMSFHDVRSAVADFLTVFRAEKIQTISITPHDMAQLDQAISNGIGKVDIKEFGTIEMQGREQHLAGITLDKARAAADFTIAAPQLSGYNEPTANLDQSPRMDLTLNVNKINGLITNLGGVKLLPAELAGKTFTLDIHPLVTLNYQSSEGLAPIALAETRSPELSVPGGVNVDEVRDALLSLPFWPDNIKQQLEGIKDWRHTLIVPASDNTTAVTVSGQPGVYMRLNDQGSAMLFWAKDGIVYSLSGPLSQEKAVQIAESIR
jgi:anti-sigma factor RsiW